MLQFPLLYEKYLLVVADEHAPYAACIQEYVNIFYQ